MIFLKLIVTNLLRHRIRSLISIAGIAFSVAAMLTIVTVLQGAVAMFSGILSSDSQIIVFERNVSDLFFSSVPSEAVQTISSWSIVQHADPVLFGIVSSSDHPIITCFGITDADARLRKATWIQGDRSNFAVPFRLAMGCFTSLASSRRRMASRMAECSCRFPQRKRSFTRRAPPPSSRSSCAAKMTFRISKR
jgi:putative ABC transport system permease protein